MSRPSGRGKPTARRGAMMAVALFGFIMGLLSGMLLYGGHVDRLMLETGRLRDELESVKEDNERLRADPQGPERPVRELSVRFLDLKDERLRLEMNRRLRALLVDKIVGTPVTELDPLQAAHIVQDRLFAVEETLWRAEIQGAYLIWETLILYVKLHPAGELQADPQPI